MLNELKTAAEAGTEIDVGGQAVPAHLLLDLLNGTSDIQVHPRGVRLKGARIVDEMIWDWQHLVVPLELTNCVLENRMVLDHALITGLTFEGCYLPSFLGHQLVSSHSLGFLRSTIDGLVRLRDATITGSLLLTGSSIKGERDDIYWIGDTVALHGSRLRVSGAIMLNDGCNVQGTVILQGARTGGDVLLRSGQFLNPGGDAIRVGGIDVAGSLLVSGGVRVEGRVHLDRATIRGDVELDGAQIRATDREALSADGIDIGGRLSMRHGFSAQGTVRMSAARIAGSVRCSGATFSTPGGLALGLPADIGGNVSLNEGFIADGLVNLGGAHIGGQLTCVGGSFTELLAGDMTVSNSFRWRDLASFPEKVTLRRSHVGELDDDVMSWPTRNLVITGFRYDRISDRAPRAPQQRVAWIRRQHGYAPEPYQQLAAVYRAGGQIAEATFVAMAQQEDLMRHGDLSRPARAWMWFLGRSIGHGYRPGRAAWALVILYLITLATIWLGVRSEAFIQVGNIAPQTQVTASHCSYEYPCLSPSSYALENITPILNLHQAENWQPKSDSRSSWLLREWLYLSTIIGYAVTTLLAAALSGLARNT